MRVLLRLTQGGSSSYYRKGKLVPTKCEVRRKQYSSSQELGGCIIHVDESIIRVSGCIFHMSCSIIHVSGCITYMS